METLEEFDQEYPLSKMFCRRLTKEEFESEALTYTEKALQDLFHTLDQNPLLCEKVVRRRKQAELEKAGLKSFIKAKFFSAMDGRMNRCNAVEMNELQERLRQLKEEMRKVQTYACEAKGNTQRTSKRLAEKRQKEQGEASTSASSSLPSAAAIPPPPLPPPPPPPLPSSSNLVLKTPLKDKSNLHTREAMVLATPDLLDSYGLARLNRRCKSIGDLRVPESDHNIQPIQSIHSELLAANHFKRLRSTGIHRSPGGTPSKIPKSQQAQEGEVSSPASAFNTTLLNKFRNTKSPSENAPRSPSTSDSESSGFATPPGSPRESNPL
ncbi:mitochondrial fission regulator 1-like [Carcharodon carcharias]|uniref:mitochondrial fission regulator 1-like n=1 Tax=Carcharodon carcharias TaxID=13397 RepID=UPI001B7E497C|nr:mitochondrial fission regulator 1-like [Carcharodon carcharias]